MNLKTMEKTSIQPKLYKVIKYRIEENFAFIIHKKCGIITP